MVLTTSITTGAIYPSGSLDASWAVAVHCCCRSSSPVTPFVAPVMARFRLLIVTEERTPGEMSPTLSNVTSTPNR